MGLGRLVRKMIKSTVKWSLKDDENVKYASESAPSPVGISKGTAIGRDGPSPNGMNFTVYAATGGKVIEFRTYDPRTDRSNTSLYVITEKEDLGEELGQIITKESLSR